MWMLLTTWPSIFSISSLGIHFGFVESHIMEHGLYMLEGRGSLMAVQTNIYNIEERWWMGSGLWESTPPCR